MSQKPTTRKGRNLNQKLIEAVTRTQGKSETVILAKYEIIRQIPRKLQNRKG